MRLVANLGYSREAERYWLEHPLPVDRGSATGRAVLEGRAIHIPDVLADPEYRATRYQELAGYRSALSVPLLRDRTTIGIFSLTRDEVNPFTDKQIELVTTFADQAVIAIENTRLFEAEHQRTRELNESLEQQTATSEVLQVISSSPGDLEPVFATMLANAVRICDANFGNIYRWDGEALNIIASHNTPTAFAEQQRSTPFRPGPKNPLGRVVATKTVVHLPDVAASEAYTERDPVTVAGVEVAGIRTLVAVPLLKENELVGAFALSRQEVRPFTDKQIELVQNFANQAVIAIENTRLLAELRESLQQQTATADVLKVISRSTFDLQTVLNTLVESAARLCEADIALIVRPQGSNLEVLANYRLSQASIDVLISTPIASGRWTLSGRVLAEGRTVNIPDWRADPGYTFSAAQELSSLQSGLGVPLMREGLPVGVMNLWRTQVRPFSDKQIELVTTFANQAVIAIENARLLNELREFLRQQTATADVLKVISRSTFDLQAVLDTLVQSAARLCEADTVAIGRPKGESLYFEASYGYSREYAEFVASHPAGIDRGTVSGRAFLESKIVHVLDVVGDPEYAYERQRVGGFRTLLGVPLLREGSPISTISLGRNSVRPFTDKQIELVTTFADQAVIAIENVRLFEAEQQRTRELTESLEQQTATSEVLQVISSSPGNVQPVFSTVLENAVRICEAKFGLLYLYEGGGFRSVAACDVPPAFAAALGKEQFPPAPGGVLDAVLKTGRTVHVSDLAATQGYLERHHRMVAGVELGGIRTVVGVPMLKHNELVGVIGIYRQEVRPFTDKQIALLTNFAAQAVIAIENTRRLSELRESLQEQTATSEVLQVISSSPGDVQPVFDTRTGLRMMPTFPRSPLTFRKASFPRYG